MYLRILSLAVFCFCALPVLGQIKVVQEVPDNDTLMYHVGWTQETDFCARQIYYGSYDSTRQRSMFPQLKYEWKSGINLGGSAFLASGSRPLVKDIDLNFGWDHSFNDHWTFSTGFSRYFNMLGTAGLVNIRNVFRNYLFVSLEEDNDILNNIVQASVESGRNGVHDWVANLESFHDFYIIDEDYRHRYLSLELKNDIYAGSVNSPDAYAQLYDGVAPVGGKLQLHYYSGLLNDNMALNLTYETRVMKWIPEFNYNLAFQRFPQSTRDGTYLLNAPLFYGDLTVIFYF